MPSQPPRGLVTNRSRVHPDGNLFGEVSVELPAEFCEALLTRPGLRIERIVSLGHASPEGFWYDQAEEEWVLLVTGAARLRFEGAPAIDLRPGDHLLIPRHARHRVDWTDPAQPTVWLALHLDASARSGPADLSPGDPCNRDAPAR